MDKAILVIDMPSCCDECFALDDSGDYPFCLITQEQKGYTFRTREQKMDKCPLKKLPEKYDMDNIPYNLDYNTYIDEILENKNRILWDVTYDFKRNCCRLERSRM